ncbi:MAG TPA: hypothetical protein VM097_08725 [Mycobacteriales bacterium]|nr:hypothetical protein [Mycobacteriales bacterium]
MKRALVLLVSLGLLCLASGAADAGSSKRLERTVVGSYGPYPAPVTGCSSATGSFACLIVKTRPKETFFSAKVTDAHGQPVFVQVQRSGSSDVFFCGQTSRPLPVRPGSTLSFHLGLNNWLVTADCPTNRLKTTGTIRVTLSNRR